MSGAENTNKAQEIASSFGEKQVRLLKEKEMIAPTRYNDLVLDPTTLLSWRMATALEALNLDPDADHAEEFLVAIEEDLTLREDAPVLELERGFHEVEQERLEELFANDYLFFSERAGQLVEYEGRII